jgi:hypothetical protein
MTDTTQHDYDAALADVLHPKHELAMDIGMAVRRHAAALASLRERVGTWEEQDARRVTHIRRLMDELDRVRQVARVDHDRLVRQAQEADEAGFARYDTAIREAESLRADLAHLTRERDALVEERDTILRNAREEARRLAAWVAENHDDAARAAGGRDDG